MYAVAIAMIARASFRLDPISTIEFIPMNINQITFVDDKKSRFKVDPEPARRINPDIRIGAKRGLTTRKSIEDVVSFRVGAKLSFSLLHNTLFDQSPQHRNGFVPSRPHTHCHHLFVVETIVSPWGTDVVNLLEKLRENL